mmetsp:Transcript_28307/g.78159  ORF Transcript_28307/g.78159 Transcript_28307/m.78159 type:complete len:237 (+) Transcript_28307:910-1620(+)
MRNKRKYKKIVSMTPPIPGAASAGDRPAAAAAAADAGASAFRATLTHFDSSPMCRAGKGPPGATMASRTCSPVARWPQRELILLRMPLYVCSRVEPPKRHQSAKTSKPCFSALPFLRARARASKPLAATEHNTTPLYSWTLIFPWGGGQKSLESEEPFLPTRASLQSAISPAALSAARPCGRTPSKSRTQSTKIASPMLRTVKCLSKTLDMAKPARLLASPEERGSRWTNRAKWHL